MSSWTPSVIMVTHTQVELADATVTVNLHNADHGNPEDFFILICM